MRVHWAFSLRRIWGCLGNLYLAILCEKLWYLSSFWIFKTTYKLSIFIIILKLRYMNSDMFMIYPKSHSQQVTEWLLYLSVSTLLHMSFTLPPHCFPAFYSEFFQTYQKVERLVPWSLVYSSPRFINCYHLLYVLFRIWFSFSHALSRYLDIIYIST